MQVRQIMDAIFAVVTVSVTLNGEEKSGLRHDAERCDLEPSIVARKLFALPVQRVARGAD